ncbi:MAG: response regulator [Rhodanobacteraceae bacterium]
MTRILMADDDEEFCTLMADYLADQGFAVDVVHDGAAAVQRAGDGYAALLLDVMMPVKDGFQALREIRAHHGLPILMLTARGEDVDRIVGLEMGADDYLRKPANPRELVARLRAILRRSQGGNHGDADIELTDLVVSRSRREALFKGQALSLTSIEFEVLAALAEAAGSPLDRDALSNQALGRRWLPGDRSLDMHIVSLRKKLGDQRIKTVRGRGYQLLR